MFRIGGRESAVKMKFINLICSFNIEVIRVKMKGYFKWIDNILSVKNMPGIQLATENFLD